MINWSKKFRLNLEDQSQELYLTLAWVILNKTCFHGAIPGVPRFFVVKKAPFMAAYQALVKQGEVKSSAILINKKIFSLNIFEFKKVLIHEMSHQYCFEVLGRPHRNHPSLWKKIYNEALSRV